MDHLTVLREKIGLLRDEITHSERLQEIQQERTLTG
jgi:hypothetical protein